MRPVARWVSFLAGRWRAQLSEALTVIEGAAVGARLVSAVCAHSQSVSRVRRRLLRGVADFAERFRDPARPARCPSRSGCRAALTLAFSFLCFVSTQAIVCLLLFYVFVEVT
jgi:hypothetical protein